ncbi:integrase [Marivirga lumbricoides]|uniref:Integrase n=2 Tax=Marivirga lumbricoides TaxID=1046115 RepID=A0ABQ1N9L1_9BACT|nr:integrase [Marivirga lumbricoides]
MLKDNSVEGNTRIIAKITDGRQFQLRLSTGFSVKPTHWSKKNKNVLSANPNAVAINKGLKEFTKKALSVYLEAKEKRLIPNREYFELEMKPNKEVENRNTEFWKVFDYYMNEKKKSFSLSTVKKFNSLKKHLQNFELERKIPLQFETITNKVMKELQSYFYEDVVIKIDSEGKEYKGLNTQTTAKYLGTFKMFMNWALMNKYSKNTDFKEFKIKHQPRTIKAVLNDVDLGKLRSYESKEKKYLNNVRDLLILSCLTGLRFSDYSSIKSEHLIKDNESNYSLLMMQKKTNDYVEIPLNDEALQIVRKLLKNEIHPISNQKMNLYAKELCKLAKINEPFEVIQYKGNIRLTKSIPKYELITTHTGRRTFATNLLLKGVPAEIVMEFTGHRDYESFSKYVNIPKKSKMDIVRNVMAG